MNVNNFGDRNLTSVHHGRTNIWNRYNAHAQAKRDSSVFNSCHDHCYGAAPPPMMGGFGMPMFGMPMFGGFGHGNQNVNVNIGPSKSYVVGNVFGQVGGLVQQNWTSISNFVGKLFNRT